MGNIRSVCGCGKCDMEGSRRSESASMVGGDTERRGNQHGR